MVAEMPNDGCSGESRPHNSLNGLVEGIPEPWVRQEGRHHGVVRPTSLLHLSSENSFNQPIEGVVWPTSLQQLSFGHPFNQPIHLYPDYSTRTALAYSPVLVSETTNKRLQQKSFGTTRFTPPPLVFYQSVNQSINLQGWLL